MTISVVWALNQMLRIPFIHQFSFITDTVLDHHRQTHNRHDFFELIVKNAQNHIYYAIFIRYWTIPLLRFGANPRALTVIWKTEKHANMSIKQKFRWRFQMADGLISTATFRLLEFLATFLAIFNDFGRFLAIFGKFWNFGQNKRLWDRFLAKFWSLSDHGSNFYWNFGH